MDLFKKNASQLAEQYAVKKEKIKSDFITSITNLLNGKLQKKSALDIGIDELEVSRKETVKDIDELKDLLIKENK